MSPDEEDAADEDNCISLKTILIMNPKLRFCSRKVSKRSPSRLLQCPSSLQEEDFLSQLRSAFPQLDADVPFELFSVSVSRKMIPLNVTRRTPKEIWRFMVSSGNKDKRLYVQLKTELPKFTEERPKPCVRMKTRYLPFRARILAHPNIHCLNHMQSHTVSNLMKFKCHPDLDVLGFRRILYSKFPSLRNRPYDFLMCNTQTDLVPLEVDEETAENIHRALKSATLFIRLKVPSRFIIKRRKGAALVEGQLRRSVAKVKQQKDEMNMNYAHNESAVESMIPPESSGNEGDDNASTEKLEEAWGGQMVQRSDRNGTSNTMETVMDQTSAMETQTLVSLSCKVCGIRQRKKSLLTKHAVSHIDDLRTMCGVCGMHLPSAETLRKHLLGHQTLHVCDTCGKSFVTVNGLQKHSVSHTAQRPHTCPFCPKTFALKSVMKTHMRFHDKHKPARCKFCHKAFTTQSQLKSHSTVHSTERPYMCIVCGKALKSVNSLSAHIRTHSRQGMVDKTCKVCRMKFYSLAHLNTHMKTHKV